MRLKLDCFYENISSDQFKSELERLGESEMCKEMDFNESVFFLKKIAKTTPSYFLA